MIDKKEPLISIVTCVYNGEKYISKLLDSVLNMGYSNIEHIIVNDGSVDDTEKIILKYVDLYLAKDKSNLYIKYFKQENMGLGAATNTGLKHISGEYWTWINCDDWYKPNAFNLAMKHFRGNDDVLILNYESNYPNVKNNKPRIDLLESFSYNSKNKLKKMLYARKLKYTHFICKTSSFDGLDKRRMIDPFRYTNDVQYAAILYGNLKTHFLYRPVINFLVRDDSFFSCGKKTNADGFFHAMVNSVKLLDIADDEKSSQISLFFFNKLVYRLSNFYLKDDRNGFNNYRLEVLMPLKERILKKHRKYISCQYRLFLFYYYCPLFWKVMHFRKK